MQYTKFTFAIGKIVLYTILLIIFDMYLNTVTHILNIILDVETFINVKFCFNRSVGM